MTANPPMTSRFQGFRCLDGAKLAVHGGHTERLTKKDGEAFYACFIEARLGGTFGSALFDFMRQRGIATVTLPITYRDSNNCWFQTDVILERDVEKPAASDLAGNRNGFPISGREKR